MNATHTKVSITSMERQQTSNRFAERYGPWALVTGASSGIGRELALLLAERGLNLILQGRDASRLQAVASLVESELHRETLCVQADLAELAGVEAAIDAMGDVDLGLVIANAGIGAVRPFLTRDPRDLDELLAVNCRALLMLSHAAARQLQPRGRGGIVLLGSLLAFQGVPLMADYAASKAYVQSLGEALYLELGRVGIDVLVSAPGPTHSAFGARAGMHMGMAAAPDAVARATLDALGRHCTVRPGWLAWLLEASLAPLPRLARSRILGRVMSSMAQPR